MRENFNYKRRIIIGLILIGIMLLFYSIGYVNAGWTSPNTIYNVENITLDTDPVGISPTSQKSFYSISKDRWYILYVVDIDINDIVCYYSYSDSGDITEWNNGGSITGTYLTNGGTEQQCHSVMTAWCYDNTNELGHLVWFEGFGRTPRAIYYKNFTIAVEGSLTFGTKREIIDIASSAGSVDICLSHSNLPIIAYGGYYATIKRSWASICNSIDGYSGTWTAIEYRPEYTHNTIAVIPTGNQSCIIINGNAYLENPLRMFAIDFTSTSNSTEQGTVFSDLNVYRYEYSNNAHLLSYGVSYNSTHGFVHYTDSSSYDSFGFIFDFATLTKTEEYCTDNNGVENSIRAWTGGSVHDNEFFSTSFEKINNAVPHDIFGNEYHVIGYDNYFNESAVNEICEPATSEWGLYSGGMFTSRMTDSSNRSLIIVENGDWIAVTYWTLSGEYGEAPPPNGNDKEYGVFDWSGVKYWLAFIVFIIIAIFAIYIKRSER